MVNYHHHLPALIPCYLWSAQHVFFFHSVLSTVMLSLTPFSFISFFTQSIHLFFGLPLSLHQSTFIFITLLVTCVSSLLFRCPYQDKRFPFNFSVTVATFKLPLIYSFLNLSILVTSYIHLNILISATCNLCSSVFFTAKHSYPYRTTGLITDLW